MLCVVCCAARCRGQPCASMPRPHPNPTRRAGTRSTRCGGCCRGMADPSMAGRRCAACVSSTWTSRCESRATLAAASSCTRDRWPHPREGRGATALEGASFGTVVGPAESGDYFQTTFSTFRLLSNYLNSYSKSSNTPNSKHTLNFRVESLLLPRRKTCLILGRYQCALCRGGHEWANT